MVGDLVGWQEVPGEVLSGQGYGFIFVDHGRRVLVGSTSNIAILTFEIRNSPIRLSF